MAEWNETTYPVTRRYRERGNQNAPEERSLVAAAITAAENTGGTLHLNERHLNAPFARNGILQAGGALTDTMFKEIEVAPPRLTPAVKRHAEDNQSWRGRNPAPREEVRKALLESFTNGWRHHHQYVWYFSSGVDSRLLLDVVHSLPDRPPALKNVTLFICIGPEIPIFKDIMDRYGIENYHGYREGVGVDYMAEALDFDYAWRWVNGFYTPATPIGPALDEAVQQGKLNGDSPIYTVGGWLANEVPAVRNRLQAPLPGLAQRAKNVAKKAIGRRLPTPIRGSAPRYGNDLFNEIMDEYYYRRHFSAQLAYCECSGYKSPYTDISVTPILPRERTGLIEDREMREMTGYPQAALNQPPNALGVDSRLSEDTEEKIKQAYNDSTYAELVAGGINDVPPYGASSFWRHYTAASTVQELERQGVQVK